VKELNTIAEGLDSLPQDTELEATAVNTASATEDTTPMAGAAQAAEQTAEATESISEPSELIDDEVEPSDKLSESIADESQVTTELSKPTSDESDELVAVTSETVTVPIRFNHERRDLSLDEAANLSQKGLAAEPIMSKLRYLAATQNKNVGQVVDALLNADEATRREQIFKRVGGDEELTNQLLAAEKSKYQKAVDEMAAAEELTGQQEITDVNNRLAEEFLGLQKEFPEISEVSKVPKLVIKEAVDKNISLLDAYLRFLHSENRKIKAAKATQEAAAQAAVGSQLSQDTNHTSAEIEAMIRGIWG